MYDNILIDGRHMLYRVASTHRDLGIESFEGRVPTGAIYGFIRTALTVYEDHAAEGCRMFISWEGGYKHRRALHPGYKKSRRKRKEDPQHKQFILSMNDQEQILKSLLSNMGWTQLWADGYEADDVMATMAKQLEGKTAIYTGDYDLHQCVNDNVHVIAPVRVAHRGGPNKAREKVWNKEAVVERWGVSPVRIPEVKALAGDVSDCIPGAEGIGEVWAKKLLSQYSLNELMAASHGGVLTGSHEGKDWRSERHATLIQKSRQSIWTSLELALVIDNAPVQPIPKKSDRAKMIQAFKAFQFKTLLRPTVLNTIQTIMT